MNKNECRMERVSNFTVGVILLIAGLLIALSGVTVLPIVGLFIAAPVLIIAGIFLASPRSNACSVFAQKTRSILNK